MLILHATYVAHMLILHVTYVLILHATYVAIVDSGNACADPERFVRGGPLLPTFFFFFFFFFFLDDKGRKGQNTTISRPS